jgi:hypothetical protein
LNALQAALAVANKAIVAALGAAHFHEYVQGLMDLNTQKSRLFWVALIVTPMGHDSSWVYVLTKYGVVPDPC